MKDISPIYAAMAPCLPEKSLAIALFLRTVRLTRMPHSQQSFVLPVTGKLFKPQHFSNLPIPDAMHSFCFSTLTLQKLGKKFQSLPESVETSTLKNSNANLNTHVPQNDSSVLSSSNSPSFSAISSPGTSEDVKETGVAALHRLLADEKALVSTLSSLSPSTRDTLIRHLFDVVHQQQVSQSLTFKDTTASAIPSAEATASEEFCSSQQPHHLPINQTSSSTSKFPHVDKNEKAREFASDGSTTDSSENLASTSVETHHVPTHSSHRSSIADAVFNSLDINQDGQVSQREFRIWYNLHFKSSQGSTERLSAVSNTDTIKTSTYRSAPVPLSTIDTPSLTKKETFPHVPLSATAQSFLSPNKQNHTNNLEGFSESLPEKDSFTPAEETVSSGKIYFTKSEKGSDALQSVVSSSTLKKSDSSQTFSEKKTVEEGYSETFKGTKGFQKESIERRFIPITITRYQTYVVLLRSSIPYIGFGIMDNCLMLLCGEMIDFYMGALLGFSTLAAAGLGNMISCASGVLTGGFIERLVYRLGLPSAKLTPSQADSRIVKNIHLSGSMLGICIGCLIGMFPLLLLRNESKKKK